MKLLENQQSHPLNNGAFKHILRINAKGSSMLQYVLSITIYSGLFSDAANPRV